jgi:hypothetical protein
VTLPTQTGDPGTVGRIHVFAVADDGTPHAELALTAPKDQTVTAGQALAAQLGSVTGGVTDATGYHARVQWGDGTVTEDATVDTSGAITGTHTYAQPGTYTVHVTAWDTLSSSTAASTVTVTNASAQPAISASASADGATVTVNGTGFAAGEQVNVELGAGHVAARASAAGAVHASIPARRDATSGRYAVTATGASSKAPATATIATAAQPERAAYHPQATLSVTSGSRGTAITVDGSGFAPNETVSGRFGNGLAATALHANGDGVIVATISVPGAAVPGPTGITLAGADSAAKVELPFAVTTKK